MESVLLWTMGGLSPRVGIGGGEGAIVFGLFINRYVSSSFSSTSRRIISSSNTLYCCCNVLHAFWTLSARDRNSSFSCVRATTFSDMSSKCVWKFCLLCSERSLKVTLSPQPMCSHITSRRGHSSFRWWERLVSLIPGIPQPLGQSTTRKGHEGWCMIVTTPATSL